MNASNKFSKHCYLYSLNGVLVDAGSVTNVARALGIQPITLSRKIYTCTPHNGHFCCYNATFEGFINHVSVKYNLNDFETKAMLQVAGMKSIHFIGENSFEKKTAYWESEFEYGKRWDWNEYFRPHLEQIENEYRQIKKQAEEHKTRRHPIVEQIIYRSKVIFKEKLIKQKNN